MEVLSFALVLVTFSCSSMVGPVETKEDWGYVNVRQDANMFWWLFYTEKAEDYTSYPLVIYLQGGPGGSATGYGNFMEIGPWHVNLKPRNTTWIKKANVLFFDSPVGAGFSYVTNKSALARSNKQNADDLTVALSSILGTLPEFQKTPLYIFGESYGGKIAVDFALALTKAIKNKSMTCNFKGIALGDSWISPLDFVDSWGDYLFGLSNLDDPGYYATKNKAYEIKKTMLNEQYSKATEQFLELQDLVLNLTNNVDWYNILKNAGGPAGNRGVNKFPKDHTLHKLFSRVVEPLYGDALYDLMNGRVRSKLGNIPKNVTWSNQSSDVFGALSEDFMKDVIASVDKLLTDESYLDVNIYSGQLDLVVDILGTNRWVKKLKWGGLKGFLNAPRKPITFPPNYNAGFVKSFKQLSFFWIFKAGHMVPVDAPETVFKMVDMILSKKK